MPVVFADPGVSIPYWNEATKDQWLLWIATWIGRVLDAFDL
jgi:SHS family lactate transporter-like MFS transporter